MRPLSLRIYGLVASLLLTLGTFLIVMRPGFFDLGMKSATIVILILAVLQGVVQGICFLHLSGAKEGRWNLAVFISTISIIITIVVGSIWIMNKLNYNMMTTSSGY